MKTDDMVMKAHLQHWNSEFSLPTRLVKHGRSCVHPIMIISENGAGRIITADGSEDDKITPEGLPSYKVPPPVDHVPAAETLPTPNQPTVEDGTIEENNEDADWNADDQDEPDDNDEEWEDHEDDCIMEAPYCGRRIKILYENG